MEQKVTQSKDVNKVYVILFVIVSLMSLWSMYYQYDIKQILMTLNNQSQIIEKNCSTLSKQVDKTQSQPMIAEKCPLQDSIKPVSDINCKDKIATVIAIYKLKEASLYGKDSLEEVLASLVNNKDKFIEPKIADIKAIQPDIISLEQLKGNFAQIKISMMTSEQNQNYKGFKQWLSKYLIIRKISPSTTSVTEIKLILDNITKLLDKQDFKAIQILLNTLPVEEKAFLAGWENELNNIIKLHTDIDSLLEYMNSPEFLNL